MAATKPTPREVTRDELRLLDHYGALNGRERQRFLLAIETAARLADRQPFGSVPAFDAFMLRAVDSDPVGPSAPAPVAPTPPGATGAGRTAFAAFMAAALAPVAMASDGDPQEAFVDEGMRQAARVAPDDFASARAAAEALGRALRSPDGAARGGATLALAVVLSQAARWREGG